MPKKLLVQPMQPYVSGKTDQILLEDIDTAMRKKTEAERMDFILDLAVLAASTDYTNETISNTIQNYILNYMYPTDDQNPPNLKVDLFLERFKAIEERRMERIYIPHGQFALEQTKTHSDTWIWTHGLEENQAGLLSHISMYQLATAHIGNPRSKLSKIIRRAFTPAELKKELNSLNKQLTNIENQITLAEKEENPNKEKIEKLEEEVAPLYKKKKAKQETSDKIPDTILSTLQTSLFYLNLKNLNPEIKKQACTGFRFEGYGRENLLADISEESLTKDQELPKAEADYLLKVDTAKTEVEKAKYEIEYLTVYKKKIDEENVKQKKLKSEDPQAKAELLRQHKLEKQEEKLPENNKHAEAKTYEFIRDMDFSFLRNKTTYDAIQAAVLANVKRAVSDASDPEWTPERLPEWKSERLKDQVLDKLENEINTQAANMKHASISRYFYDSKEFNAIRDDLKELQHALTKGHNTENVKNIILSTKKLSIDCQKYLNKKPGKKTSSYGKKRETLVTTIETNIKHLQDSLRDAAPDLIDVFEDALNAKYVDTKKKKPQKSNSKNDVKKLENNSIKKAPVQVK